jgi:hypothetical protein
VCIRRPVFDAVANNNFALQFTGCATRSHTHSDRGRETLSIVSRAALHSRHRRSKLTIVFTTTDAEVFIIDVPFERTIGARDSTEFARAQRVCGIGGRAIHIPIDFAEHDSDLPDWGKRNPAGLRPEVRGSPLSCATKGDIQIHPIDRNALGKSIDRLSAG